MEQAPDTSVYLRSAPSSQSGSARRWLPPRRAEWLALVPNPRPPDPPIRFASELQKFGLLPTALLFEGQRCVYNHNSVVFYYRDGMRVMNRPYRQRRTCFQQSGIIPAPHRRKGQSQFQRSCLNPCLFLI